LQRRSYFPWCIFGLIAAAALPQQAIAHAEQEAASLRGCHSSNQVHEIKMNRDLVQTEPSPPTFPQAPAALLLQTTQRHRVVIGNLSGARVKKTRQEKELG
jgi:hypothetical protein